ncbi:hypothetical protein CBR_g8338 [Chara braunii]|uniref:Uncharacterized protein n=1 Tax=Chara braunii TaxID=69332 RepID=A0A388KLV8_CHABU|nr:hypothetical protein CBR_g8338 [Chara braunii]|eukprot:GBG71039.1 hypothetical protein CBR_g8338 [Chara braunii]
MSILFANVDLVEATTEVDLCEVLGSTEAIKKLRDERQEVHVLDRDPVEGAVVCAYAEFGGSVFLDEEATCTEGGGVWINESFFKEFIELSLHFFGLGNGDLVGWSTWRSVTGFHINVYYDGGVLILESNGDRGVIAGGRETGFAGTSVTDEVTDSSDVKESPKLEGCELVVGGGRYGGLIRRDVAWMRGGGTTDGAEKAIVLKGTGTLKTKLEQRRCRQGMPFETADVEYRVQFRHHTDPKEDRWFARA